MKRPNHKDYLSDNQIHASERAIEYQEDLERYIDFLESKPNSELLVNKEFPSAINEIVVTHQSVTYAQNDEDNSSDIQELVIETKDVGAGMFISIRTEKWSIESIDDLETVLQDFKKRVNIKN